MIEKFLPKIVDVKPDEMRALGWSCGYFFCVLASYYILRPIRDEMAVAGGVENIPWLFTGTLLAMLLANPVFTALVSKLPRLQFISTTYRFFILTLLGFFVILNWGSPDLNVWAGRLFYVWTGVFSLFVVSVFWAFMADTFSAEQSTRLFGFIAFGGTFGGVLGSALTATVTSFLPPVSLLILAALLLELAVHSMTKLSASATANLSTPPVDGIQGQINDPALDFDDVSYGRFDRPIGGGLFSGISNILRSKYLAGISGYMLLFTVTATFLYFQQAGIVAETFEGRALRTSVFARIDLLVNALTLVTQIFITGRIVKRLGVAFTLAILPAICAVGFLLLGFTPTLLALVIFQVLRRATNFAIARPTRETLFTVLRREDKYKAKSFIDTFVYRAGDQIGAWAWASMAATGLTLAGVAFVSVPLSLVWLVLGIWLGRRQKETILRRSRA